MEKKKFRDMVNSAESFDDLLTALNMATNTTKKSKKSSKKNIEKKQIEEILEGDIVSKKEEIEVQNEDIETPKDDVKASKKKREIYLSEIRVKPEPIDIFYSDPPKAKEKSKTLYMSEKKKPREKVEMLFEGKKIIPERIELTMSEKRTKPKTKPLYMSEVKTKTVEDPLYMSQEVRKPEKLPDLVFSGKMKERVAAIVQHQEQEVEVPVSQEDFSAYFNECVKKASEPKKVPAAAAITKQPKVRKKMDPGEGFIDVFEVLRKRARTMSPAVYYDGEEGTYNVYLGSACLVSMPPVDIYMKDRIRIAKNLDKRMHTTKKGKNVDLSVYMALDKYDSIFNTSSREAYVTKVMGISKNRDSIRVNYDLSKTDKNRKMSLFMKSLIEKYAAIHESLGMGIIQRKNQKIGQHLNLGFER